MKTLSVFLPQEPRKETLRKTSCGHLNFISDRAISGLSQRANVENDGGVIYWEQYIRIRGPYLICLLLIHALQGITQAKI